RDHQAQLTRGRASLDRVQELLAEGKDFVRVAKGDPTRFGQHEVPSFADEQLLPEDFLEAMNLSADGRVGQAELLTRANDAPLLRDRPEVEEVVVVELFHNAEYMSVFSKG